MQSSLLLGILSELLLTTLALITVSVLYFSIGGIALWITSKKK